MNKRLKKLFLNGTAKKFEIENNKEFDSDGNIQRVEYPFYADNVERFAEFCINSNGFAIY